MRFFLKHKLIIIFSIITIEYLVCILFIFALNRNLLFDLNNRFKLDLETQYVSVHFADPFLATDNKVLEITQTIGTKGILNRKLAFSSDIMYLDWSDELIKQRLKELLDISWKQDVPVIIHLNGSQWWESRSDLWNWFDPAKEGFDPSNRDNVEWINWNTPLDHWQRNWGKEMKIAPPPCLTSPRLISEKKRKIQKVIVPEIMRWYNKMKFLGREDLLAGVDLDTELSIESPLGYCALASLGYTSENIGEKYDEILNQVVKNHMEIIARSTHEAGMPKDKIYSHGWSEQGDGAKNALHAPISTVFNSYSRPAWSVYRYAEDPLAILKSSLQSHDSSAWAITEYYYKGNKNILSDVKKIENNYWYTALKRVISSPGLKIVDIYNWEKESNQSVQSNQEAIWAINKILSDIIN